MRKDASWRCMLPTQPPPHTFEVVKWTSTMGGTRVRTGDVTFSGGVCMGTLYDYAYVSVAKPISSFVMQWHVPLEIENKEVGEDVENVVERRKDVVTMAMKYIYQCDSDIPPDIGDEFRSGAFEELNVPFGEVKHAGW